jgi:GNAT superfamily N-acetyltransferase
MRLIVGSGTVPGILAYRLDEDDQPAQTVAWCALGPRADFPVLERSRILKPVDDQQVWSLVCFFVAKPYRRMGLTLGLIEAAKSFARDCQARILEAYPEDPEKGEMPAVFAFTGLASTFRAAGFEEVARRSPHRPVMRCYLEAG